MTAGAEGFVDIDGNRTYYQRRGAGRPIVFVHGWSLDLEYWDPQVAHFSQHYETWAYDLRGMGQSAGARPPYSFDRMVADLRGFLDHFSIEDPILCGHSLGGTIVLQLAVDDPDRPSAVVLADTPAKPSLLINPLSSFFLALGVGFFRLIGLSNPLAPLAPIFVRMFFNRQFRQQRPEVIEAWHEQYLSNSVPGVVNSFRAEAWRQNVNARLTEVVAPTLVLRGSKDHLVSQRQAECYANGIPGARLVLIDGSGHMTLTEKPAIFNRDMQAFLDGLES